MFAMLYGHLPFEDQALKNHRLNLNVYRLYQHIARNSPEIPNHVSASPEAVELIKGMLRSDPSKRLGISEIFRHSWFANSQLW
jgi:serine/threonine protein kinase